MPAKAKPRRPGERVAVSGATNVTAEVVAPQGAGPRVEHVAPGVALTGAQEVTEPAQATLTVEPAPGAGEKAQQPPQAAKESPAGSGREPVADGAMEERSVSDAERRAYLAPPTAGPRVTRCGGQMQQLGRSRTIVVTPGPGEPAD